MSAIAAPAPALHERPAAAGRAWRRFARNKGAVVGGVIVAVLLLGALLAPLLAQYDPLKTSFSTIRKPPSPEHWFGTDEIGRDLFARILFGARASLAAGLISVGVALCAGLPLGIIAGYRGGWFDTIVSRATEAMLAMPFLILAIALSAFLGPSLGNAMIAIGIAATPIFIRLARAQAIAVKHEDYVEGARAVGLSDSWIVLRYIVPNAIAPLLVQATLTLAQAIIIEASLSFLGLGQQPPSPSWGSMLNTAKNFMAQAPWMSLYPGAAIFLAVLGFNLLGDGLRDVLDPRETE